MALRARTAKCAFPGVPEHTFETRERNVEFCPNHRKSGARLLSAVALAGRQSTGKVAIPLPPQTDAGPFCRKCRRRPSGPLCYSCVWPRLDVDDPSDSGWKVLPKPSPTAPECGSCHARPRNPYCDHCLNELLGLQHWD